MIFFLTNPLPPVPSRVVIIVLQKDRRALGYADCSRSTGTKYCFMSPTGMVD